MTLWYAGIFTLSSFVAFLSFSMLMAGVVSKRAEEDLQSDVAEFSSIFASKGIDGLKAEISREAASDGVDKVFLRLLATNGDQLASSDMASWRNIGIDRTALKRAAGGDSCIFETVSLPEKEPDVRVVYGLIAPGKVLQIGELEEDDQFIEAFWEGLGIEMTALILFAALIGWFMARRALSGLEEVTRTAEEISNGALERRAPIKARGVELDRLATTFNGMLDRIRDLIASMREMSDNIAHDLRSPITRIRGVAEMTLTTGKTVSEYETMAASTIEECDQLLTMINTMLEISEAELGTQKLEMQEVDVAKVVQDACELFEPLAEDQNISIYAEIPESCFVRGDIRKLQRLLANLLDNAVKYTSSGGTVTVSVDQKDDEATISVKDTGAGMSEDDLPHIFDRFYRCDRSRSKPGVGLGLSLVRATVKAHGGKINVASSPGEGSTFEISFPRSTRKQL